MIPDRPGTWCCELLYDGAYVFLADETEALIVECDTLEPVVGARVRLEFSPGRWPGTSLDAHANVLWAWSFSDDAADLWLWRFYFDAATRRLEFQRRERTWTRFYVSRGAHVFSTKDEGTYTMHTIETGESKVAFVTASGRGYAYPIWASRDGSRIWTYGDSGGFKLRDVATQAVLMNLRDGEEMYAGDRQRPAFVDRRANEFIAIRADGTLKRTALALPSKVFGYGTVDFQESGTREKYVFYSTKSGEAVFSTERRSDRNSEVRITRRTILVRTAGVNIVVFRPLRELESNVLAVLRDARWSRFFALDGDHALAGIIYSLHT